MKVGRFRVTEELIRMALALPDDMQIINIMRTDTPGVFAFDAVHQSFPDASEGAEPCAVAVTYTMDHDMRPVTWMDTDLSVL